MTVRLQANKVDSFYSSLLQMRMTTHFQNVPTGQKSTGKLLPRHFSIVKLKKNFENEVWKTIDLLNRKTEKMDRKQATSSIPTSIALNCARREVCTQHYPIP